MASWKSFCTFAPINHLRGRRLESETSSAFQSGFIRKPRWFAEVLFSVMNSAKIGGVRNWGVEANKAERLF